MAKNTEQVLSQQCSLDKLPNRDNALQMLCNPSKFKVPHVGSGVPTFKHSIDEAKLGSVTEEQDLGVMVTQSFRSSISAIWLLLKQIGFRKY